MASVERAKEQIYRAKRRYDDAIREADRQLDDDMRSARQTLDEAEGRRSDSCKIDELRMLAMRCYFESNYHYRGVADEEGSPEPPPRPASSLPHKKRKNFGADSVARDEAAAEDVMPRSELRKCFNDFLSMLGLCPMKKKDKLWNDFLSSHLHLDAAERRSGRSLRLVRVASVSAFIETLDHIYREFSDYRPIAASRSATPEYARQCRDAGARR